MQEYNTVVKVMTEQCFIRTNIHIDRTRQICWLSVAHEYNSNIQTTFITSLLKYSSHFVFFYIFGLLHANKLTFEWNTHCNMVHTETDECPLMQFQQDYFVAFELYRINAHDTLQWWLSLYNISYASHLIEPVWYHLPVTNLALHDPHCVPNQGNVCTVNSIAKYLYLQ